jgi:serine/threonine protein kinase/tetratricopeptide (TPR) repeat protein
MIGTNLSHYRVLEKLGEGGMGEVYRAEDTRLKRQVALKVLPEGMARDPERLRRFQREAEAIASLSHPGIVTIFSVEEAEGVHFLTMELVSGKRLDEIVPSGGMALEDFVEVALPLVEALVAAHDRGITHRDLKPANIMVTDDGMLKVLDFGLAKLRQPDTVSDETHLPTEALTQEGLVLGTIPYMAPEQLEGRPVDHRADVFSVGIVLHEMLTGERPFKGKSSASLITAILRDRPGPVSKLRSDVPPALERVILRCLQKDPDRRFQTTKDLRNELEEMPTAPEEDAEGRVRSIAVLPFADMSPQKDQDYFCEGIAEDIINALSKIGDLRVASRMSAFQFESRTAKPGEVGERLDVETVLSGSVRKAGERVRISAELVNARDGYQLWSERYDRDLEDVFEVQDEISSNIVRALEVTLSPKEKKAIQRQAPVNIQAYEYYLRGRGLFHRVTKAARARALEMFNRAIEIDPNFAAAYAGIADLSAYARMYHGGGEADLERADEASQKALELAPELAEAHASRGLALSLQNRHEEATEAFETAIRLDPQLFEAHYFYARTNWVQGKLEEAAEHFKEAMKVRPEDFQAPSLLGSIYHGLGQRDKSLKYQKRAYENIEKHLELHPDDARALYLGSGSLIGMGETERGLEWASRAVAIDPTDTSILYNVACTYSEAGEVEEALDYLEKAVAAGFNQKEWIINDGDLEPLRDHPRYKALIESMG